MNGMMAGSLLDHVVRTARGGANVLLTSVSADGTPHVSSATRLVAAGEGCVQLTSFFCPATIENIRSRSKVAVVVMDPWEGDGYQLTGEVAEIEELGVLDGYDPQLEDQPRVPQVQRRLTVRVARALLYSSRPHDDEPLPL